MNGRGKHERERRKCSGDLGRTEIRVPEWKERPNIKWGCEMKLGNAESQRSSQATVRLKNVLKEKGNHGSQTLDDDRS